MSERHRRRRRDRRAIIFLAQAWLRPDARLQFQPLNVNIAKNNARIFSRNAPIKHKLIANATT